MEFPLLKDLVIILGSSLIVVLAFHAIRLPSIIGFLVTGVIIGPHFLGLIEAVEQVRLLSEIGVVLLLFIIGTEFSVSRLAKMKRAVLGAGSLQVGLTAIAATLLLYLFRRSFTEALIFGLMVSLSSTAIILKLHQARGDFSAPHGRLSFGILLFQDIIVIPMILLVPFLGDAASAPLLDIVSALGKGLLLVVFVLAAARWILPRLLFQIAKTRDRELFLVTVIFLCFMIAWVTEHAGLSLSLGAFLAGMILADTEYSHHAIDHVIPFRDIFVSLFFISIGMLADVNFFISHAAMILAMAAVVILLKFAVAGGVAKLLGYPIRTAILTGLALCQIGEFSFLLFEVARTNGLVTPNQQQYFLNVSILTMAVAPFAINLGPSLLDRTPFKSSVNRDDLEGDDGYNNHLIIVGFGPIGRNVARVSRDEGILYKIIEMNPVTVQEQKSADEPIIYGDATRGEVLMHAGIERARAIVFALSDMTACEKMLRRVRELNPKIFIIVRSRFASDVETMVQAGADEVVHEEFEASIEVFARTLRKFDIPQEKIRNHIDKIRNENLGSAFS